MEARLVLCPASKKLTALVVSVTVYVTYRETLFERRTPTALCFSTLLFYDGVLTGGVQLEQR